MEDRKEDKLEEALQWGILMAMKIEERTVWCSHSCQEHCQGQKKQNFYQKHLHDVAIECAHWMAWLSWCPQPAMVVLVPFCGWPQKWIFKFVLLIDGCTLGGSKSLTRRGKPDMLHMYMRRILGRFLHMSSELGENHSRKSCFFIKDNLTKLGWNKATQRFDNYR